MNNNKVEFTREQLYEEVWSMPMVALAKKYGLSDVGLRKICIRLQVPLPPQGYHLRKRKGSKPQLKPPPKGTPLKHTAYHCQPPAHLTDESVEDISIPELAFEAVPENLIVVPPDMDSPHPLIKLTAKALAKAKPSDGGMLDAQQRGGLNIAVFPENIDRVLILMDTLIKACLARGHVVTIDRERKATLINLMGESIEICLEERGRRIDYQPTPKELRKSDRFKTRTYPKYSYISSGNFTIKATTISDPWEVIISEREKSRLEANLNKTIVLLIKYALSVKERRLQREQREREHREREERKHEMWRLISLEKEKLKQLDIEVDQWHKSQRIRKYVEAARQSAISAYGTINPGSEMDQWLVWVEQQADRLDPFVDSPYSVLDDEDKYRWW